MAIIESFNNVTLYVNPEGVYQVQVNSEVVWEGMSRFQADEIFGSFIDD